MCTTQVCTVASGQVRRIESGKPLEPVAAHDQRIPQTTVAQLGEHRRPLFRALAAGGAEPEAEHLPLALEIDPDRDIDGTVGDLRAADLDDQAVDQEHRIERVERPALPGQHVLDDEIGDLTDRLTRDLGAVDLLQMLLDLARRQAFRVERDDVARQPLQAALILRDRERLERPVPIPWDAQIDLPDLRLTTAAGKQCDCHAA